MNVLCIIGTAVECAKAILRVINFSVCCCINTLLFKISRIIYNRIDTALVLAQTEGVVSRYLLDCAHKLLPWFTEQSEHKSQ
jgi:hypothetical protein